MRLSKTNVSLKGSKDMVVAALLFVMSAALLGLVAYPSFSSLSSLKAEADSHNQELDSLTARRENLEALSNISATLDDDLNLVKKAVPDSNEIPALLSQVQQIALESGVSIKTLQYSGSAGSSLQAAPEVQSPPASAEEDLGAPSPSEGALPSPKSPTSSSKILVQVNVSGSYQQMVLFLKTLESARRLLSFESLRLASDSKEDISHMALSTNLTGYYSPSVSSPNQSMDLKGALFKNIIETLRSYKEYENKEIPAEVPSP